MTWLIALGASAAVVGCGSSSSGDTQASTDASGFKGTVKIALISDYTGDLAVASGMEGAQAYIDYVNAHGGVDGYKLVGEQFDAGSSPTTAVQAARRAIASKPAGIISASFVINSGLPLLAKSGVPTVGDGTVVGYTGHDNVFPMMGDLATHNSDVYIVIAKKYAHATKLALIGSAINAPQQKILLDAADKDGVTFVYKSLNEPFVPKAPEYLRMAQEIKRSGAEAVVDFGVTRLDQLQVYLNQIGASNIKVIGSETPPVSESANGTMYAIPWALTFVKDNPGITTYNEQMTKAGHGKELPTLAYAPLRWAQTALLVQGLKEAGAPFDNDAVVKALSNVKDFTADGIIAPASFPEYQTTGTSCYSVGQVVKGEWTALINGKSPFVCGGPSQPIGG